jgi:hypothetical protein
MVRIVLIGVLLFFSAAALPAQEHATVVAIHSVSQNRYIPGYAGGDGVVASSGVTVRDRSFIYRLETETKFYEMEAYGKAKFAVGDSLTFQIDDKHKQITILGGHKPQHFNLVGEELKSK